jgi:hypothetical protein
VSNTPLPNRCVDHVGIAPNSQELRQEGVSEITTTRPHIPGFHA